MEAVMDRESLFEMSADMLEDVEPLGEVVDLSGKVAVVTGSAGLALFVVNRLAEAGCKVVFGARHEDWGEMAVEALADVGREDVAFKQTDVRKVSDCYDLVAFAEETYGPVDIVVPVAATWRARAFVDVDEETWDDILDTDLKGQYFTIQAAARSMIKAGRPGKIVCISSVAHRADDLYKLAMMTPYNAAKAGVVGIARGIAKELKQYGINCNCVCPGAMVTPGAIMNNITTQELYGFEWARAQMEGGAEIPVCSTPDDVARMILVMCTSVSDFMYGQVIECDGGSQFSMAEGGWSYTLPGGRCAATAEAAETDA